jgi:thiol-disulfide isomerase/thioredoxin
MPVRTNRASRLLVRRVNLVGTLVALVLCVAATETLRAADPPAPKLALSFKPVQKDADVEVPDPADVEKCRVEVERTKTTSGWKVYGPQGQLLRRYVDTDGDNVVDQWRYFKHGFEVYRDIDTNADNKVDQTRWLHTGGSRWGIDDNQDGRIDRWKTLSAHEAGYEVVRAIRTGDDKVLEAILLDAKDARTLGLTDAATKAVLASVADAGRKLQDALAKDRTIDRTSVWVRFDASNPSVVPADAGMAEGDLMVYANAMAIVETNGTPALLQLGELVRVGDVWKLTQVPQPMGNNQQIAAGGVLMVPGDAGLAELAAIPMLNEKIRELLEQLRELDESAPAISAGRDALAKYNRQRATLLEQLVAASETPEEREQFWKQMVDGLAAAVQTGAYPDGFTKLESLEEQVAKSPKSPLVPYVTYRRMNAEYSRRMQSAATDDRGEVQTWWLEQLEAFGKAYPDSEDSADALFQLANALEFAGEFEESKKWYGMVATKHPNTDTGERAAGAQRRIDSVGQPFTLRGTDLRGGTLDLARLRDKVVLVVYWATWSQPLEQELPQLAALKATYGRDGFEIVGVNVDVVREQIKPFVDRNRLDWPQIHEPGGLESPPAKAYGVIAVPTMFLIDKEGKVASRTAAIEELKEAVPALLEK